MTNLEIMMIIRQLRELKGFSQEVISEELRISPRAYSKLERGETLLSVVRLYKIGKILEIDPVSILEFKANKIFNQRQTISQINQETEKSLILYENLLKQKNQIIDLLQESLNSKR